MIRSFPQGQTARRLFYAVCSLLLLILLFYGLVKAQAFLAPLVTAIVLSLIVLPLSRKMEHVMNRLLSSLLNALMLLLIALGIIALVIYQVQSISQDWNKIKDRMKPQLEQAETFLIQHSPLQETDLKILQENTKSSNGSGFSLASQNIMNILGKFTGFVGQFLLIFIYIFFLLYYRRRFKVFLLRIFPDHRREEVREVIHSTSRVAPRYLVGKLILMGIIAVIYAAGLGLTGINNFIVLSVISALLALIPYIGNIIAYLLAMAFGFMTTGDSSIFLGVSLTFGLGQFFQTYFLEPYLLGDQVDVHPFFVILAVIIGNLVWGIIGMVLAIPLLGMLTILLLHIRQLHEVGLLLSKKTIRVDEQ